MLTRLSCLLAMAAMGCSSSPAAAVPPSFVTVTAPADVVASADGTYTWHIQFSYQDSDDYATTLKITFTNGSSSTNAQTPLQQAVLSQTVDVGPIAKSYQGKSFSYTLVIVDQSGLESAPYSGTVKFD